MLSNIYISHIATLLGVKDWQVENCCVLLEDGATVPFISRYRKERTGGLDDVAVSEIKHWNGVFQEMDKRKATILNTIAEAGKLTPELKKEIQECVSSTRLEDIYLPFRPKRKTKAGVAMEKGLGPLADAILSCKVSNPAAEAAKYVKGSVASADDALQGARDIIAERVSESSTAREALRQIFRTRKICSKVTKAAQNDPAAQKYRSYFSVNQPVSRIPSHMLLAMLRGRDEGFLKVEIDADPEKCCNKLYYDLCQEHGYPSRENGLQIRQAVEDSYSRLLEPSISGEILREAKARADLKAIEVFGENLRQLLLAPPLGQKRVMAIDPGFRTGCKVVCLDERGNLQEHGVIFPHPPAARKMEAIDSVLALADTFEIEAVAIGNGTAGRETEDFIRRVGLPDSVKIYSVSEDGASVYSASEVGREEFPEEDVTVRGAVSIGRRLMDPLSELVKIDPKSLGVGQYQHDVDQKLLREKLDYIVEQCVNSVGVNLNTASPYLLQYVSGIGPSLARAIVKYRTQNGNFTKRSELLDVPRLGEKAYEQCAGFLRIEGATNPLDNSAVHPESYHIVDRMAASLGVKTRELVGNEKLCSSIKPSQFVEEHFGLPTVNDILQELRKPGRDPRGESSAFSFADDIHDLADLRPGMELPGIVTNVTDFGAFVDIGIHTKGLVHVSNMGGKKLRLRDQIKVLVVSVDQDRERIALKLISGGV